jgi:adenine-specific DNA glycosylase
MEHNRKGYSLIYYVKSKDVNVLSTELPVCPVQTQSVWWFRGSKANINLATKFESREYSDINLCILRNEDSALALESKPQASVMLNIL